MYLSLLLLLLLRTECKIFKVHRELSNESKIVKFSIIHTVQKMKFSIKDFLSKCDQIHMKLRIWSHLLKKSLMENFIFCAVTKIKSAIAGLIIHLWLLAVATLIVSDISSDCFPAKYRYFEQQVVVYLFILYS